MNRAALFILIVATLSGPRRAAADVDPAAKQRADERFAAGIRFYDAAEQKHDASLYNQAYLEFAQAYAIYQDDRVLWNLALSEVDTKRYVEAIAHLELYDAHEHVLNQPTHPKFRLFGDYLERARQGTGHLTILAALGASIRVDGRDVGVAPLTGTVDVAVGEHAVEAQAAGGVLHASVRAVAGQTSSVDLQPPPPPAAAPTALPPHVLVEGPPPEMLPSQRSDATSWWTPQHSVTVGAGALAVAGIALGTYFRLAAQADANDGASIRSGIARGACSSAAAPPACGDLQNKSQAADRNAMLSDVAFAVGGASAAATVLLLLFLPSSHDAGPVSCTPSVGPGLVGASGRF